MVVFTHSHQYPGGTVLNVLQPLEAFAGDSEKQGITVIQPGGDEGMDEFLSVWQGECGAEFGNVPEVKK